ncbi:MAG TPA: DUF420 domain-containing protein [Candidatus Polarisedimenticolia bacterium]|nr:DUF420 domain-containing protein [Candidatus Polarisedimenticolia bacterium]
MRLPDFNALMNVVAATALVSGYVAIRRGRRATHRALMLTALAASVLFLAGYLTHHARVGSVPYRGTGTLRYVYFAILIPHTLLAAATLPLVAVTLTRALRERFDAHRRLARWTLPIWLYVSVTGVIVYLMLYRFGGAG